LKRIIFIVLVITSSQAAQENKSIIHSAKRITIEGLLKALLFSYDDLIKGSIKFSVRSCLSFSPLLVDYGCEAGWIAFYQGTACIPHALIKYTLIEQCYAGMHAVMVNAGGDYPACMQKNPYMHGTLRVFMPIIIKRLLGFCINCVIDNWIIEEDQEDYAESYL
jgi:hypothetical protein